MRFAERILPYLLVLAVLAWVMACGAKFWNTNDDEHMAMIAHGYGLSDSGSPGLVFSNVLWGWMVMHLGVAGWQGYTVGQYAAVWLSCLALCYSLYRCRAPVLLAAALLIAAFVPTLLNMQFSITSGLLAVAGLALALSGGGEGSRWPWAAAAALLVFSALVRFNEFLLVMCVVSPFCVWHMLRKSDHAGRRR